MSEKVKTRVAFHEMGHALVAHFGENSDPVHRVTIIPRGTAALGITWSRPLEDRFISTEPELKDMLARAMGGRVAEELVFHDLSTGAQNDIETATELARAMVTEYGMSEKLGPQSFGRDDPNAIFGGGPRLSAATAQTIDEEIARLLSDAHEQAEQILSEHRELLDRLANVLLVVETIDGDDLGAYVSGDKAIPNVEELRRQEAVKQEQAAAAAAAAAPEPVKSGPRITLPPAPPMPTVD